MNLLKMLVAVCVSFCSMANAEVSATLSEWWRLQGPYGAAFYEEMDKTLSCLRERKETVLVGAPPVWQLSRDSALGKFSKESPARRFYSHMQVALELIALKKEGYCPLPNQLGGRFPLIEHLLRDFHYIYHKYDVTVKNEFFPVCKEEHELLKKSFQQLITAQLPHCRPFMKYWGGSFATLRRSLMKREDDDVPTEPELWRTIQLFHADYR